jgi:hypothetical protein
MKNKIKIVKSKEENFFLFEKVTIKNDKMDQNKKIKKY